MQVDHKPLLQIFAPNKRLPTLTATRMQHYAIFLQTFSYDIKYRNTKVHTNADAMSRLPVRSEQLPNFDETDAFEINQINTLPVTLKELANETCKDKEYAKLLQGLNNGTEVKKEDWFSVDQNEFTLQGNCIFKCHRAVIPKVLRNKILQELHMAHFGIVKMKALARSYCWWPGITKDIENVCKNCVNYNKIKHNPAIVQVHAWEIPFERVHVDYAGPFMGHYFFYFSRHVY